MLISLQWLRDFVDLPGDLNPPELAERITCTTAEVEKTKPVRVEAKGLIAACVKSQQPVAGQSNLRVVELDVGDGRVIETVTAAPVLHVGLSVVYAPPGASVGNHAVRETRVAGRTSVGLILPGDAIGIPMAFSEAIFLGEDVSPGQPLLPEAFEDWVFEIDNKSITHRPDLWGHYGMAREIAAITGLELKPYPVVPLDELTSGTLPAIEIEIDDPSACPRYSGLLVQGVPTRPAPLWMQLRLGHVGMRPITGLVDLTNYIMADLGQPMHAFDAAKVDRIEVGWAHDGERFRTLDGIERTLTTQTLMIQSRRRAIALAGIMGGLDTEVSESTASLLLESANFDAATIRRTATRLGLRTDAGSRFEKSLDPGNTVLAIQRFLELSKPIYPNLTLTGRLCDRYPKPREPAVVPVHPGHVARTIGRGVTFDEADRLLRPLGFEVTGHDTHWRIHVPSFRSTADVTIEDDVIEELARFIGYAAIEPAMPRVSIRSFAPHKLHQLERRTLEHFTSVHGFCEIHSYLWYDGEWLERLGYDPGRCVELTNPSAYGLHRLRRWLMPGVLSAVVRNRFHFPAFSILEVGSVFEPRQDGDGEYRHVALVIAQRGKRIEDELYSRLKAALESWAWQRFGSAVAFNPGPATDRPWEHPHRTAAVVIDGVDSGRISVVDGSLRRVMDEHLGSWAVAWAELRLDELARLKPKTETLGTIPNYPWIELDFSLLVPKAQRYNDVVKQVRAFQHPLLKRIQYVGCYEGQSIPADRRSLTLRTVIGDDARTLIDDDANTFRTAFEKHLETVGYAIRRA